MCHDVPDQEYMTFINHILCEDTTVQYLCSTGSTVRLRIVGCDGEVRQAT